MGHATGYQRAILQDRRLGRYRSREAGAANGGTGSEKPAVTRSLIIDLQKNKIDFPEANQFIAKAAETDPEFRGMMVSTLADRTRLSADQVALLKKVAVSDKETPALAGQGNRHLAKECDIAGRNRCVDRRGWLASTLWRSPIQSCRRF